MKINLPTHYDCVCAFGNYCITAAQLRRHHLRAFSGPFDWVMTDPGIGLSRYVDLVCRDFKNYFSRETLEFVENRRTAQDDKDKDYYRDRISGFWFLHDFPAGVSLSESYETVAQKYRRRVARFYAQTAHGRVLLVFQTRSVHVVDEEMIQGIRRLRAKLNPAVDLLVLENCDAMHEISFRNVADGVYYAQAWFHKAELNVLQGDKKLCDMFYAAIRYRHKWRMWLRKKYLRIIACLHMSSGERKAARKRLLGD